MEIYVIVYYLHKWYISGCRIVLIRNSTEVKQELGIEIERCITLLFQYVHQTSEKVVAA